MTTRYNRILESATRGELISDEDWIYVMSEFCKLDENAIAEFCALDENAIAEFCKLDIS